MQDQLGDLLGHLKTHGAMRTLEWNCRVQVLLSYLFHLMSVGKPLPVSASSPAKCGGREHPPRGGSIEIPTQVSDVKAMALLAEPLDGLEEAPS